MRLTAQTIENYQVKINASGHTFLSDEPIAKGGDNQGPGPYDLLLGSLAACKIITVHMYARRKEWALEKVIVHMDHQKMRASECHDAESEGATPVDVITCEISFEGDLDEAQIRRLGEIADRCPVHRTLTSETKIRTTVK